MHDSYVVTQRLQREIADVVSVDRDLPARHVIETWQQINHCRLSAAGRSQYGGNLAWFGIQVEFIEGRRAILVGEPNILETYMPGCPTHRFGVRSFFYRRYRIQYCEQTLPG